MTPGASPFCRVPARLIWNISPLSAAHSICPGSFHRSLLLLFTFHHRQTLAWLCPNSTMCSVDTLTNKHPHAASIIAGDFNKASLRQVMPNFHQNVSCPTRGPNTLDHCYTQFLKRPTMPAQYRILANRTMPPFSSHRNINKGSFRNPQWREK